MSTPARLVELKCPCCQSDHWEIDSDYRGADMVPGGVELPYEERPYLCSACGTKGTGYSVGRKSPLEFFLQPHPMYPMSRWEFHRWVRVLRENFPEHPSLEKLGKSWRPYPLKGAEISSVARAFSLREKGKSSIRKIRRFGRLLEVSCFCRCATWWFGGRPSSPFCGFDRMSGDPFAHHGIRRNGVSLRSDPATISIM